MNKNKTEKSNTKELNCLTLSKKIELIWWNWTFLNGILNIKWSPIDIKNQRSTITNSNNLFFDSSLWKLTQKMSTICNYHDRKFKKQLARLAWLIFHSHPTHSFRFYCQHIFQISSFTFLHTLCEKVEHCSRFGKIRSFLAQSK